VPPPVEVKPPKPGSAKEKLFGDLQKFADKKAGAAPEPEPAKAQEPAAKTPEPEPKAGEPTPPPAPEPPKPAEGKKAEKVSPWKLVDEHKAARTAAEAELAKLRALVPDPAKAEADATRLKNAEAKAVELEKVLSFIDYQQSEEFKTKHEEPYVSAWKKIAAELPQIQLKVPGTQQIREATPQDILQLMDMPVGEAQAVAEEAFGNLADRVMAWRDKLKDLFDSRNEALKVAKENSAKWKTEQAQKFQQATETIGKFVNDVWTHVQAEALKDPTHGKWLAEVKGDDEINAKLKRGVELADEAFKLDPRDPGLTPEQRAYAVRAHSALRNKAAAYPRLMLELKRLTQKLEEVTKERDGYKNSTPPRTPAPPGQAPVGELKGMARVQAALEKIAKSG
jgi:hypothetical protein